MTDLRYLEKRLLIRVGSLLEPYGYAKKPVQHSFRMRKPFGWASIHLAFVRHESDFDVVVSVSLRVDHVQDRIQANDPLVSNADRINSATVGAQLGALSGRGQLRWTVTGDEDIEQAAQSIAESCVATAFPFVDEYSDLEHTLEALRKADRIAMLISPFEDKRRKTIQALSEFIATEKQEESRGQSSNS